MSEKLEKLEHEKYVAEKKLTAAIHREKQLQSELKRLFHSEAAQKKLDMLIEERKKTLAIGGS